MSAHQLHREVDRDLIERHIDALYLYAKDGYVFLPIFFSKKEGASRPPLEAKFYKLSNGRQGLVDACVIAARKAANHFESTVFPPPVATFQSEKATEANLAYGLAISIDLD